MIYLNIVQYEHDEDGEVPVGEQFIRFLTITEAVNYIKKYNKEDYTLSDKPANVDESDYVLYSE